MKKQSFSFFKLLFSILLGIILYALLMKIFFKSGWNFDIFNQKHWEFAWNKWQRGWVIKGKKDVMFFLLVLSFLPGWIISTFIIYSIPIKKILLFPLRIFQNSKRKKLQQQSLDMAKGVNVKLPAQAKAKPAKSDIPHNSQIDRLRGRKTPQGANAASAASAQQPAPKQETVSSEEMSVEELQLAHLQRWNELVTSLENQGVFCFRSTKIGSFAVKLTILVKDTVFWFIEGPIVPDEWTLNDDRIPPVWTGKKETIPSPLAAAHTARETFKRYMTDNTDFPNTAVHAFLVMDSGKILNVEKIEKELAHFDIAVLKLPPSENTDLPDMSAMLNYIKTFEASDMAFNDAVAESIMALEED